MLLELWELYSLEVFYNRQVGEPIYWQIPIKLQLIFIFPFGWF